MKTRTRNILIVLAIMTCVPTLRAAVIVKANNASNLNLPESWVGGSVPGTNDVAQWDSTVTAANTNLLGADMSWAGIRVINPGGVPQINAGNTLALGAAGIDMSTATFGFTFSNSVAVAADQMWDTGTNKQLSVYGPLNMNGRTVSMTSASSGKIQFKNTVSGSGTWITSHPNTQMSGGTVATNVSASVTSGGVLLFDSASGVVTLPRVRSVTLNSGLLSVSGINTTNSNDSISHTLMVDTNPMGGCNFISLTPGTKNAQLLAPELVRTNNAVVVIRGNRLGEAPGNSIGNFFVTTPPDLVGGNGAEGPASLSIIPWTIGSLSASGGGNGSYDQTFVTYETGRGFRPLNLSTELTNEVASGSETWLNVRVPNGTNWSLTADTAINALLLQGSDPNNGNTVVSGSGTLTIRSGAVIMGYHRNAAPRIEVPLAFGNRQGVIAYAQGKASAITNTISGTGGLVLYQVVTAAVQGSGGTGVTLSSPCTYSGDTVILGKVSTSVNNVLPNGSRTGNVYLYGIWDAGGPSINGLSGNGLFSKASGTGTLSLGDNNADGDFTGTITDGSATMPLVKIGAGTQRLAGNCSYDGATTVSGGTLIMDGYFTNTAVTVNSGATLRGKGTVDKSGHAIMINNGATLAPGDGNGLGTMTVPQGNVVFTNGAALTVKVGKAGSSLLSVAGAVTNLIGSVTIPVTIEGEGYGKWMVIRAASIVPSFTSATLGCTVTIENSGKELWVNRPSKGTVISFQ